MSKPTVTLLYDCTPEQWTQQLEKLEKRFDFALEAEALRLERQALKPPQPMPALTITPPWWTRMMGGVD